MKSIILFCIVYLNSIFLFAHDPNKAFFIFTLKQNTVEVTAEFPWTLRNALLKFNPILEKSKSTKDFENTFIEYIKANLILKDSEGNVLTFNTFRNLKKTSHSHQNIYLLVFKGSNITEIKNTLMFDLFDNHTNNNIIQIDNKQIEFETTKEVPSYTLDNNQKKKNYPILIIFLIPLFVFGLRYLRNINRYNF